MKPPAFVAVPHGPETTTSFAPAVPAAVTALIFVALATVNDATGAPPIVTDVTPDMPDPLIEIAVPPATGPAFGEIVVIAGAAK